MSSNSSGNLFAPNERGASPFSTCRNALAIVASWWSDAHLTPHLVLTGSVGQWLGHGLSKSDCSGARCHSPPKRSLQ